MEFEDIAFWITGIFLGLFILGFIAFLPLAFFCNSIFEATDGEHTGLITAIEHNNNMIWDADLVYFKSSDETTQEEIYCIDKDLIKKAKEASSSKQIVTITFHNDFYFKRRDCNGGISIIEDIR